MIGDNIEDINQSNIREIHLAHKIKDAVESGDPINKSQLLVDAGYSPKSLSMFQKKSFLKVLDEILPDDLVLAAHRELLTNKNVEKHSFPITMPDEDIRDVAEHIGTVIQIYKDSKNQCKHCWIQKVNLNYIKDGVDLAYKLKGSYAPEKHAIAIQDFSEMSDEELEAFLKEQEKNKIRYNQSLVDISPEKDYKSDPSSMIENDFSTDF
jgi:hypothetical protein